MSDDLPTRTPSATSQDTPAIDDPNPYRPPTAERPAQPVAEGPDLPPATIRRLRIVSVIIDVIGTILLIAASGFGLGVVLPLLASIQILTTKKFLGIFTILGLLALLVFAGLGALIRRGPSWNAGIVLLTLFVTSGLTIAVLLAWHVGAKATETMLSVLLLAFGAGGLVAYRLGVPLFGSKRITRRALWAKDPQP